MVPSVNASVCCVPLSPQTVDDLGVGTVGLRLNYRSGRFFGVCSSPKQLARQNLGHNYRAWSMAHVDLLGGASPKLSAGMELSFLKLFWLSLHLKHVEDISDIPPSIYRVMFCEILSV